MWSIIEGVLWLLDGFFNIINDIWRYRFFDNEYVNKIFTGAIIVACSWLVLKVILELIMNHIVKSDDRGSPLTIFKGIALAIVMMFLITPLFQFGHDFSTALTDSVIEVSGLENNNQESKISSSLIRTMVHKNEMEKEDIEYLVDNWKDIDINETSGGAVGIGEYYVYSVNFFMIIVLAVVTVALLFFIAVQMAKRVMEIALFKIIGPFCCTGLTNNQSKSFDTWTKSTMGLFLITVVQFVSLGLLINMFGSAIEDNGTLTGIFLIIGALLFIISTPTIVSSLLGQQSGIMTGFGDMQSLMALGGAVTTGLSVAKAGTMGALAMGSKVANGATSLGSNAVNSGVSMGRGVISKMFSNNNLNSEQMGAVRDSLSVNNPSKAFRQVVDGLNANRGTINDESFRQPFNKNHNPMRNQYYSQSGLEVKSDFANKWH